jgi:hypothetical protein
VLDDDGSARRGSATAGLPAGGRAWRGDQAPILQLVMARLWDAEHDHSSRVLRLDTFGPRRRTGDPAEHLLGALDCGRL